jgi:magnesium-transporting ATPase (P-type)
MKSNNEWRTPKNVSYLLLLGIQIFGALIFIWQDLSEFEQLLLNPGEQLPKDIHSDLVVFGVFCVMQISFWCRVLYVPRPFRRSNLFLNHVLLFLGRLSFIFGGALFAVVVFRHLPNLGRDADILQATKRGIIFVGCLFALFCTSLEVERLAQAFERNRN